MSVMRVHKTGNFTVMSNYHFKEKKMSLKAKGLLSLMLSLPEDWNYSVSGLVSLSKDGKDSVMSALGELEKFGYLTRERVVNDRGQFAGVEYNIFERPQPKVVENPIAEKPISDNSNEGKPTSENRTLLNTNSIKDLNNKILFELNIKDLELLDLYQEYIKVRETLKTPLTDAGITKLVKRAKRLSKGNIVVEKEMLNAAIINNWKNVYLPKQEELDLIHKDKLDELRAQYGLE